MSYASPDHYSVLGVARTATTAEIKIAYRKLARATHPDIVRTTDPARLQQAEETFKRITWAYDILSDPDDRRAYDRQPVYANNEPTWASSTQSAPTSFERRPAMESNLQWRWDEFISKPFEWSDRAIKFFTRFEWVLTFPIVALIVYLVMTNQFNTLTFWTFILTTNNAPGQESLVPMLGLVAGSLGGGVASFAVLIKTIIKHWYSFTTNESFRQRVNHLFYQLWTASTLVGGLIGFLIGRYLF